MTIAPCRTVSSFQIPERSVTHQLLKFCTIWILLASVFHQTNESCWAAEFPSDASQPQSTYAARALAAELEGDLDRRAEMVGFIDPVKESDVLSKSLLGLMRDGKEKWVSIEEAASKRAERTALNEYQEYRKTQPATVEGHWSVAAWCERRRMFDQQRAHLLAILTINPNHELARQRLQHRLINGRWYSTRELAQIATRNRWIDASVKKYGSEVQRIYAAMSNGTEKQFVAAEKRLQNIDSNDAIPAVSLVFAGSTGNASRAAIAWLDKREHPEADFVIADWAVSSPDQAVQVVCTEKLQDRSLFAFVPYLINSARSEIKAQSIPVFRPDGTLGGVRHVIAEEGREEIQVSVQDSLKVRSTIDATNLPRIPLRIRSGRDLQNEVERLSAVKRVQEINALVDIRVRAEETRKAMELQSQVNALNERQELRNRRIAEVLADTAGTDRYATIDAIWDWWGSYTERENPPIKFTSMRYNLDLESSGGYGFLTRPSLDSHECFTGGTIVHTSQGPKAIETLAVGDEVLSKNLISGELFWDLVVGTTTQPAKPIVVVETSKDSLSCTGGHLFWVSGKGWTKGRELLPGDVLHGAVEPVEVKSTESSEAEITYNLITENAHNYFVGESKLLTHDFEEPTILPVKVPGLVQ